MKVLKQLLFAAAVVICFSMTASAQQDGKKVPPKNPDNIPKIIVTPKNDDRNKPKNNEDKRNDKKKPESAYLRQEGEDQAEAV